MVYAGCAVELRLLSVKQHTTNTFGPAENADAVRGDSVAGNSNDFNRVKAFSIHLRFPKNASCVLVPVFSVQTKVLVVI